MNRNQRDRGFSILEMLVVLAIVGITAGVAITSLPRTHQVANVAAAESQVRSAVERTVSRSRLLHEPQLLSVASVVQSTAITINPASPAPPTGTTAATTLDVRAGTPYVDGAPHAISVVLADPQTGDAIALVIPPTGVLHRERWTAKGWSRISE